MRFVSLDYADWAQAARPVHRPSARPRLHVPRDVHQRSATPRHPRSPQVLRHWYACEVPIDAEMSRVEQVWQAPRGPLAIQPLGLWVPRTASHHVVYPGYVLAVTEHALDDHARYRLRLAFSGFLGDLPWPLDPTDLPWDQIVLAESWMTPNLFPRLAGYVMTL